MIKNIIPIIINSLRIIKNDLITNILKRPVYKGEVGSLSRS